MTIGLAIVLNDGLVVVADGRITNALNVADATRDDCNKIECVHAQVLAVIGGVEMVSRRACYEMRVCGSNEPTSVLSAAERGLSFGWKALEHEYPTEYARNNSFQAAVVLAGIDLAGRPYVGLVHQKKDAPILIEGPHYQRLQIGIFSTDDIATEFIMNTIRAQVPGMDLEEAVAAQQLATAAGRAIREVADQSRTVGGVVRALYLTTSGARNLTI